jgi:hypothetical protein
VVRGLLIIFWTLVIWLVFSSALGCARLGQAWQEADLRARYAPVAKEVVKP